MRIGSTEIPADGYSRVPVLVLATAADGSPALERVALSLTRPEAGVFDRKELNLTRVGGPTYFIPCTSATPGCLGSVRVQVAMASAPNAILATSDSLQLVAPTGVGSAAACLSGGNVMVLDGNNSIYGGLLTVTDAVFSATGSGPSDVQISVNPRDPTQGLIWRLWFSSRELGQPILEQVYRSAMGAAAPSPSHPGLDVSGEVGGTPKSCFGISGEFEVQRLIWVGNRLKEATVTFVERCRSDAPDSSLRGCIHIEQ